MKIKEFDKTTFCTEKCNGVVLGVINKNSYKKVVILSNRDKKLLDKLTDLKAEICNGNSCTSCSLYKTVLCNSGMQDLKKVPQSITVYEKEMEPPKPAYSAPEKVTDKWNTRADLSNNDSYKDLLYDMIAFYAKGGCKE